MAASFRFCVCVFVLFALFSSLVARPLPPTLSIKEKDDMIQQAEDMFKGRLQREDVRRSYYVSDRVSPGGPDPRHH